MHSIDMWGGQNCRISGLMWSTACHYLIDRQLSVASWWCVNNQIVINWLYPMRYHPKHVESSPPMIVRIREACPGQSTKVNCRLSYCCCWPPLSRRWSGRSTVKEEKPRSSVIPLSRDCGFLSKAAVEAVLLSALASDVFPLSTCPSTPTLKFNVLMWLSADSDILKPVWCNVNVEVSVIIFILSWTLNAITTEKIHGVSNCPQFFRSLAPA